MIPGVERFLKQCSENGIRIDLVTSALPGKVDRMLAGLSYPSPFEVMVTANMVEKGKPNPECYLLAAENMKVNPQKMPVFEDSVSKMEAASGAGATVVGIKENKMARELTAAVASSIQPDLLKAKVVRESGGIYVYPIGKDERGFLVSGVE